MERLLYGNLATNELSEQLTNSAYRWPTLTQSETLVLALRMAVPATSAAARVGTIEAFRTVTAVRAAIGRLDGSAAAGKWGIKLGDGAEVEGGNTLAPVDFDISAADLAAALNALSDIATFGTASVTRRDGSWDITFAGAAAAVPIHVTHNSLVPFCRVRKRVHELDGVWHHEIRLVEQKAAFTSSVEYHQVPPPEIAHFELGLDPTADGGARNAVQKITFAPGFRGLYKVQRGLRKSKYLSQDDGPTQLEEALAPLADEGGSFSVTRPDTNVGHIEFAGAMGDQPQALLTVVDVVSPPPDLKIVLDLDNPVARQVMRAAEIRDNKVKLPIEIEIKYEDPDDAARTITWIYQGEVEVRRELIYEGEAEVSDIDWIRPIDPSGHVPFDPTQVAVGQQFYAFHIGDGTKVVWTVDHNLGMAATGLLLWEDATGGKFLVLGTDYTYRLDPAGDGTNSLEITLLGAYATTPPAANAIAGTIIGYAVASQLDVHGHTIPQIDGLSATLDAFAARIAALEAGNFPGSAPPAVAALVGEIVRPLDRVWAIPRARRRNLPPEAPDALLGWQPYAEGSTLKDLRLLPAVHRAADSIEALPSPLPAPAASFRGRVFEDSVERPDFPGGGLPAFARAACDGREWYRVERRSDDETTWYPLAFDLELFRLSVSPDEFALRSRLSLQIGFEAALYAPSRRPAERRTVARYSLLLERGVRLASPPPAGSNIDQHFASPVVLARHDFDLTEVPSPKRFGVEMARSGADVITATASKFATVAVVDPPGSADFQLRARLTRFDVEEIPLDGRGIVAVRGLDVGLSGETEQNLGRLVIRT